QRSRHHRRHDRARHVAGGRSRRPRHVHECRAIACDRLGRGGAIQSRRRCRLSGDMTMDQPLMSVRNIETWYGPINAIRGVSLDINEGRVVAVLGANGARKTTVLRTIAGVIDPFKGSVTFEGRPIQGLDPDEVARRGVVMVPEGRQVFPFLSVRDNLLMGAMARRDKSGRAEDLERVFGWFPRLRERATQHAGLLSGGEQQMLAISRALMSRPRML